MLIITLERDDVAILDRFVIQLGDSQDTRLSIDPNGFNYMYMEINIRNGSRILFGDQGVEND